MSMAGIVSVDSLAAYTVLDPGILTAEATRAVDVARADTSAPEDAVAILDVGCG